LKLADGPAEIKDADKEINPWRVVSQRVVYDNPWIEVTHHDVIRPDGEPGIYGIVHYRNRAVGVLPIDEHGQTWLVGQYRFALGRYSWELPEGGCPEGESTLDAAKRELLEETGLEAGVWQLLGRADLSNSISDEVATIYLATDLIERQSQPEGTEVLAIRRLPFDEALAMVLDGRITDAISVMAILLYARQRGAAPVAV
jgi:8-oxo-dGTP pyrophosphatase MutT (NUDIX family)